MAVTQQLARADRRMLDECRRDVDRLDQLCSFRALSTADYLDLDWAPHLLEAAAAAAHVSEETLAVLRAATAGDTEVNPTYRDVSGSIWEHPVSMLSPTRVAEVAWGLRTIDDADFLTDSNLSAVLAGQPSDMRPGNPREYLAMHFRALQRFYDEAAERHLGTLMWWD